MVTDKTTTGNPAGHGGLNDAQAAFLHLLTSVKTDEELAELKKVVARHLLQKLRLSTQPEARELGLDSPEGYLDFVENNHRRTPYK